MAHDDRGNDVTAVAIDKDKNSQFAVKWACDNLVGNNPTLLLIHVRARNQSSDVSIKPNLKSDEYSKQLFLPYRGFCARKGVQVKEVLLDDTDIVEAIVSYVKTNSINNIVVGASARNLFTRRLRNIDVPSTLTKAAPDFCSLYVIGKGKVVTIRTATQPPPPRQPMQQSSIAMPPQLAAPEVHEPEDRAPPPGLGRGGGSWPSEGSRQPSTTSTENHDHTPSMYTLASSYNSREGMARVTDFASLGFEFSNSSTDSPPYSSSSQLTPSVEAEMMRLKQELKQTMDMYSSACREAITAKQKAAEFQQWKMDEARKFEQARLAEEAALALAKMEKAKCKAAMEAAQASQRLAELEAKKRLDAEMKAQTEAEERSKVLNALANSNLRYRRYSMEEINGSTENLSESRKIGEGGYGPVYRANLDHTQVAIKLLRSDAAQGMKQFQQEVEVLSSIRHPNMVLLLGACPESGCLVYEYMDNGSLDDRLFRRGGTPPIPWWTRFKIAAEIATGLLFLHQTKPEPLVHRDLKPANILLDHNYTCKISDVGLARLVPPCIADSVTQYHMTSAAGTFCYIDPEYQQTGMLGTKSDVYSLGIMLLQIITAKSPMGLAHTMERAIEKGTFEDILDPTVPDWPIEDTLSYAKMALKCSELRKKDRPDLATEILPELNRLRGVGFTSTGQNSYHPPTSYSTISHVRQLNSDDGSQHPNSN